MGSGTKRKLKDQPLIKRPAVNVTNTRGDDTARLCPISFEIAVNKTQFTKNGVKVHLVNDNGQYSIMVLGEIIGSLNKNKTNTVTRCGALGINYNGEIIEKKDAIYARFFRTT